MKLYTTHGDYNIMLDSSSESGNAFYCRMGRFFADRQIAKDLGEPMYDSDTSYWVLVYKGNEICGFGCLETEKLNKTGEAVITYGYVLPEHRKQGLHAALFEARLRLAAELGAQSVRGVANSSSRRLFEANGFENTRETKNYVFFSKELSRESV